MLLYFGFRPLDGESISKQKFRNDKFKSYCFRPLDGESISKPYNFGIWEWQFPSFRPLDGESISKR